MAGIMLWKILSCEKMADVLHLNFSVRAFRAPHFSCFATDIFPTKQIWSSALRGTDWQVLDHYSHHGTADCHTWGEPIHSSKLNDKKVTVYDYTYAHTALSFDYTYSHITRYYINMLISLWPFTISLTFGHPSDGILWWNSKRVIFPKVWSNFPKKWGKKCWKIQFLATKSDRKLNVTWFSDGLTQHYL